MGSLNIEKKNASYPPIYVYLCDWELREGFLNKIPKVQAVKKKWVNILSSMLSISIHRRTLKKFPRQVAAMSKTDKTLESIYTGLYTYWQSSILSTRETPANQ